MIKKYLILGVFSVMTISCSVSHNIFESSPAPVEKIHWEKVMQMVPAGQVKYIKQNSSKKVYIMTFNGEKFETVEPNYDDVHTLIFMAPNKDSLVFDNEG